MTGNEYDQRALSAQEAVEQSRREARLRSERDSAKRIADALTEEVDNLLKLVGLHETFASEFAPPKWLTPKRSKSGHKAIVTTILSDSHFDEVVDPAELGGLNAYDRDIATMRLKRYGQGLIKLSRDYMGGVTPEGCVLALGGDIYSGTLHDLAETNEDTSFGSLLYWTEQLAALIDMLADEYGKVHVPVVVGNHGRQTKKPRTKKRARDNLDWVTGHLLAREFRRDDRITFDIPDSTDAWVSIYSTTYLLTHGDQVTGGGGIGGIWPPIMRMAARKAQRYAAEGRTFDAVLMGHFHQYISALAQGLLVNGSSKGYDEFAAVNNFRPEPPQQAMWLVTPEHGATISAPVLVSDPKREGWA